jgi:hypothetical protein
MKTLHGALVAGALVLGYFVSSSAVALSDAPDESAVQPASSLEVDPTIIIPVAVDGDLADDEELPETYKWCGLPGENCLAKGNAGCCSGMCELSDDLPLTAVCL